MIKMKLIAKENVTIEENGAEIRYVLFESNGHYGFEAEYYDGEKFDGRAAAENVTKDLGKAVKLYGLFIKNKVTPVDLEYVIEDLT